MAAQLLLNEQSLIIDQCCWDTQGTYPSLNLLLNKTLPSAETSNRHARAPVGASLPVLLKLQVVPTVSKAGVGSSTFHPARPSLKPGKQTTSQLRNILIQRSDKHMQQL